MWGDFGGGSGVHFPRPVEIHLAGAGRRSPRLQMESLVDAHDILFFLLTIVVFVFLALCAKVAEKL